MNGATAEPWLKTIKIPKRAKTIIIGNNQYFFLSLKNSQNSLIKSIIKIAYPFFLHFFLFLPNKNFDFLKILGLIGLCQKGE